MTYMSRPYGTRQPGAYGYDPRPSKPGGRRVRLALHVTRPEREKAHRAAAALGISMSAYVASLINGDELDETGRPTWAGPEPGGAELPGLEKSA
jgi:hypothetical protein